MCYWKYKSIGLDTLKDQQLHFKEFICKDEIPKFTPDIQKKFDHGTENEVWIYNVTCKALHKNC